MHEHDCFRPTEIATPAAFRQINYVDCSQAVLLPLCLFTRLQTCHLRSLTKRSNMIRLLEV